MSEWLLHCTDDLKSGAYYASVDICDGEQPTFILFKKDGDKTIVVGQGEPVNPHGDLIDRPRMEGCDHMSDLLIKGVGMPKPGKPIALYLTSERKVFASVIGELTFTENDTFELPPHGRLGDLGSIERALHE